MKTLRLIFWDQLSTTLTSLQDLGPQDTILLCELREEVSRVKHHPKKIALWFAAMRHFAAELINQGWQLRYVAFDDPLNTHNLSTEVKRALDDLAISTIIVTEPGEYHYQATIKSWAESWGITVTIRPDERFLCNIPEFKQWAGNKKALRMEYFYRYMRKKYNILMTEAGSPSGGLWNYDQDNRKPPAKHIVPIKRLSHPASGILQQVLTIVRHHFADHFGDLEPFYYAVTREQALKELEHFVVNILPYFGDYQDAMLKGNAYLYHSLLSSYLNIGLLLPLELCHAAETAYMQGQVALNAAEGFIRQILGWREFIRGVYWLHMPDYATLNALEAKTPLPKFYWGQHTRMTCMAEVVSHTKIHAYSHHIQRLMVTGNFALLAGLAVQAVQEWYLAVYSDAYEWVEMPNTLGMALFGDGGLVASKPYAASGQYINKMSDFCKHCHYDVKDITGPKACPFNALYWDFLHRNHQVLIKNQRLAVTYATWAKFNDDKKSAIKARAADILQQMAEGRL